MYKVMQSGRGLLSVCVHGCVAHTYDTPHKLSSTWTRTRQRSQDTHAHTRLNVCVSSFDYSQWGSVFPDCTCVCTDVGLFLRLSQMKSLLKSVDSVNIDIYITDVCL